MPYAEHPFRGDEVASCLTHRAIPNEPAARCQDTAELLSEFSSVAWSATAMTATAAAYRPGEFWRRELPPLCAVLHGVKDLALIVVDGYVDLDPGGRPGLGSVVHAEFGVPVIGVAKSLFRDAVHAVQVRRGRSAQPLYVTAAGTGVPGAARLVAQMAGPYRIPDALRVADRLARGLEQPASRG